MILDSVAHEDGGGIRLGTNNNALVQRCVLSSKICACVVLKTLQTYAALL